MTSVWRRFGKSLALPSLTRPHPSRPCNVGPTGAEPSPEKEFA
jgi:hypothetical protein